MVSMGSFIVGIATAGTPISGVLADAAANITLVCDSVFGSVFIIMYLHSIYNKGFAIPAAETLK